jgi:hypothetical protein
MTTSQRRGSVLLDQREAGAQNGYRLARLGRLSDAEDGDETAGIRSFLAGPATASGVLPVRFCREAKIQETPYFTGAPDTIRTCDLCLRRGLDLNYKTYISTRR